MAETTGFRPVTHVIFDVDGLILDTETLYTDIMQEICNPHNKTFNWDVKKKQMGRKQREAGEILIDELNLPISVDDYCAQVNQFQKKLFPDAILLPGAEKLIRHLHRHGIPLAVATGSHQEEMQLKLTNHQQLFSLFHHSVYSTSDPEVQHGKPSPDCFLVAANRFPDKPKPSQILVLEDAPNGVEAALSAGMQVIWVPDANLERGSLTERATITLNSLDDIPLEKFGLPPYDNSS